MVEEPQKPKAYLTKSEVVKRFDISRVTLDRYIATGKISAEKGKRLGRSEPPKYGWKIALSEAQRVLKEKGPGKEKPPVKSATVDATVELAILKQRVDDQDKLLREKDSRISDIQQTADDWKQQFEQSQIRLEDLRDRGFFKKLFGG
jgi:hypothetical protein